MIGLLVRILVISLLVAVLVVGCQNVRNAHGPALTAKPDGATRIATYNVHYIQLVRASGGWSQADWEERKGPLDATVKALDADIIAFQEMETFAGGNEDSNNLTRRWLLSRNQQFEAAAIGDWREFPSTQPIFYRPERFALVDQGWFFFSETPDVIYSRTFNGSYPAFASWAQFRDRRSGSMLRVLNVHLDYSSGENRRRSTDLIVARVGPWIEQGEVVILAGDLNARAGSSLHRMLEATGLTFLPVQGSTFHFDRGLNLFGAIDHIAHSAPIAPLGEPVVLRQRLGETWPTDHYPVIADFSIAPLSTSPGK